MLGNYLSLTYRTNTGAAFGMVPWASRGLELVGTAVVVLLLIYGCRAARGSRSLSLALALLLGGAAALITSFLLPADREHDAPTALPTIEMSDKKITIGLSGRF